MSGIIYKAGVTSGRAFVRTYTNALTEDLLREGNMAALLLEELNDEDAKEMDATIKEFEATIGEVEAQLAAGAAKSEWQSALEPIKSLYNDIAANVDSLYDEGTDGKARAKTASDITKQIQDASGEFAALITCIEQVKAELQ